MDTLPPNENVRIFFTGLLVLSPIQESQCRVAIVRESGHPFCMKVEENGVPTRALTSEVQTGDIILEVTNPKLGIPQLDTFSKPGLDPRKGIDPDEDFGWL